MRYVHCDNGKFNYGLERALEIYYNWEPRKGMNLTFDYQVNPDYNRGRGPVQFATVRLHFEF